MKLFIASRKAFLAPRQPTHGGSISRQASEITVLFSPNSCEGDFIWVHWPLDSIQSTGNMALFVTILLVLGYKRSDMALFDAVLLVLGYKRSNMALFDTILPVLLGYKWLEQLLVGIVGGMFFPWPTLTLHGNCREILTYSKNPHCWKGITKCNCLHTPLLWEKKSSQTCDFITEVSLKIETSCKLCFWAPNTGVDAVCYIM